MFINGRYGMRISLVRFFFKDLQGKKRSDSAQDSKEQIDTIIKDDLQKYVFVLSQRKYCRILLSHQMIKQMSVKGKNSEQPCFLRPHA